MEKAKITVFLFMNFLGFFTPLYGGGGVEYPYPVDPGNIKGNVKKITVHTSAESWGERYKIKEYIYDENNRVQFFYGVAMYDEAQCWCIYKNGLVLERTEEISRTEYNRKGDIIGKKTFINPGVKVEFMPERNLLMEYRNSDGRIFSRDKIFLDETNSFILKIVEQHFRESSNSWEDYSVIYYEYNEDGRIKRTFSLFEGEELNQTLFYYDGLDHEIPSENVRIFGEEEEYPSFYEIISEIRNHTVEGKLMSIVTQYQGTGDRSDPESLVEYYLEVLIMEKILFNEQGDPLLQTQFFMDGSKEDEYQYEYVYDEIGNWVQLEVFRLWDDGRKSRLSQTRTIEYK